MSPSPDVPGRDRRPPGPTGRPPSDHTLGTPAHPRLVLSTDMDGTLLFDGRISDADARALARWREAGHLVVVNTGRSITALASALDGTGIAYDYAVLYTGAVLLDAADRVLAARSLPDGLVDEVLDVLSAEDPITIFCTTISGDLRLRHTHLDGTALLTAFTDSTTADLAGRAVIGIPLHLGDPSAADRIEAIIAERWGAHLTGARNQDFMDLIPAGVSKGAGLTELLAMIMAPGGAHEGETLRTIAVGDSWNDMSMHVVADVAVAMGGAPQDVVAACDDTTPSVAALVDRYLAYEATGEPGAV
ncbi:HAD-IIB family hydrolase [Actinomyces respiraculi]|uniref:HAD-IIB family hydrolase n=1 Tax=Actinomyces respiraculi TaxID=2744574 RepID=A0A7T0LKS7_9ACTO|nr:HAD-IIB family hydrolase [Actinomyces respiraculi]